MTTETQAKSYQLKGNPVIRDVPVLGNLLYDERGKEILAIHNERFRGIDRVEDTHKYKEGQPLSYSNTPRALSYNQLLRERFPDMHVLSPEEVVQYWDSIPERDSTYADTNSVPVYPKEGYNEDLRKRVLDILGRDRTKVPLKVSELGVERADNEHGFIFTETDYTQAQEAPYLKQDGRVSYEDGLIASEVGGIPVYTAQSGLRRLYRDWSDWLDAGLGDLLYSYESGRVQILQDPQGRAENLEVKVAQLQEQKEQQIAEIDARHKKASEYLRTGKF